MVTRLAPQQLAGILPRQAVRMLQDALQAAGCPDADYDARELLRIAAGKDPRLLFDPLTRPQAECLAELAAQRMQRVPLQYLAGEWDFLGLTFKVGPGVLCPRADSEVVCETAIELLQQMGKPEPRVLDLCAGTGCLGIGIRHFVPSASVTCVEKSPEAFVYLEKNCRCALKGQGGQTEDLLEPTAFEQADAPAFDWWPALYALRANAKPADAAQPVEGDLFTYCVTSVQLGFAHPAAEGGVMASITTFMGIFAVTQIPLAIVEGLLSVVVILALESYASSELGELAYSQY